jgi:hypothetical protein
MSLSSSADKRSAFAMRNGTRAPPRIYSCVVIDRRRIWTEMSIGTIVLIIVVIALRGDFSGIGGGPFYGTGYYGGGGLGLVVVIRGAGSRCVAEG